MSTPNPNIASFFKDPDASDVVNLAAQQIAAPTVRGEDLGEEEMAMGGGLRVVMILLDASGSMGVVGNDLRQDFNREFVPAIQAAREDDIAALRIGGMAFSDRTRPIWGATVDGEQRFFHSLANIPELVMREYCPETGGATALHAVIIEGTARAMAFAAQVQADTGIAPDVDILILTDGANNRDPMDPTDVRTLIEGRDKTRVRFSFFYFQTDWGLKDPLGYAVNELGIDGEDVQIFAAKPGETADDRQRRFRRLMRTMSSVSASRGMSATKAAATHAAPAGAPDEDVV